MSFLHKEHLKALFWFLVISSWALGLVAGRWFGGNSFFLEVSKVVGIPNPSQLELWWQPFVYFTLTTVAIFALSQLFFGVGAPFFLFARGMHDSVLIGELEATLGTWSLANFPMEEMWMVLMFTLILGINLPLCIWSGELGIQRAIYTLYRLRGKPVSSDFGAEPISKFTIILAASVVVGLVGAFLLSYA